MSLLKKIAEVARKLREWNKELTYGGSTCWDLPLQSSVLTGQELGFIMDSGTSRTLMQQGGRGGGRRSRGGGEGLGERRRGESSSTGGDGGRGRAGDEQGQTSDADSGRQIGRRLCSHPLLPKWQSLTSPAWPALHPNAVCDPVMGDEGRLYVAPEMVDAYRTDLLPLASVIVPNQVRATAGG